MDATHAISNFQNQRCFLYQIHFFEIFKMVIEESYVDFLFRNSTYLLTEMMTSQ